MKYFAASGSSASFTEIAPLSGTTLIPNSGNRVGFFSSLGYSNPIVTGNYQDSTFISNDDASTIDRAGLRLHNNKFISDGNNNQVNHNNAAANSGLSALIPGDETFLVRFDGEGSNFSIQNAKLYYVVLNAVSGISGAINEIATFQNVWLNEITSGNFWKQVAGTGGGFSNFIELPDKPVSSASHDWYVCASLSPLDTNVHTNAGFYTEVEFV